MCIGVVLCFLCLGFATLSDYVCLEYFLSFKSFQPLIFKYIYSLSSFEDSNYLYIKLPEEFL